MNKRIPSVFKDFAKKEKFSEIDFMSFKDWISAKENKAKDWIIVAKKVKLPIIIFTHIAV